MPANADNTRNGWRRETSPDTITVAEMLASVKGRDEELFVNEDGTLNMAPYTDAELEAQVNKAHLNA